MVDIVPSGPGQGSEYFFVAACLAAVYPHELGPHFSADIWLLRVAWNLVGSYVHVICEKTKRQKHMPGEGFAQQISVTVGVALLVEWAARKKAIAACVLQ